MKRLVKFQYYMRGFTFRSLFVADDADWERLKLWCDGQKEVYFGEIAGKYSELSLIFDLEDFKVLSTDQEFIGRFQATIGSVFGVDILENMYDRCGECGEGCDDDQMIDGVCVYCREDES